MKYFILILCLVVTNVLSAQPMTPPFIRIGGYFDTSINQVLGGTTHSNNETVWVDCGTTSLTVSVPIMPSPPYGVIWNSSANFTRSSVGGISYIQTVQLDPNKTDGFISVVYMMTGHTHTSGAVIINIKQKPSTPVLTASNVCAGGSATFSASSTYGLQSTRPMSILWETTGGVRVNGVTSFISPPGTSSSVTIANSSTGSYSARAIVPTCSNTQSLPVTGNLGTPTIKNPNYWLFDSWSNMWQFSQTPEGPAVAYTFSVAAGSASIVQNYGDAYITTSTGASICVYGTNTCGAGTPFCFYIPASGGMLKSVFPNPAQNVVTIELNNVDNIDYLPKTLNLFSESSTKLVKSLSVEDLYKQNSFIDKNTISIPVSDLPRGTYFIHAIPAQGSKQATQKFRVVLD